MTSTVGTALLAEVYTKAFAGEGVTVTVDVSSTRLGVTGFSCTIVYNTVLVDLVEQCDIGWKIANRTLKGMNASAHYTPVKITRLVSNITPKRAEMTTLWDREKRIPKKGYTNAIKFSATLSFKR